MSSLPIIHNAQTNGTAIIKGWKTSDDGKSMYWGEEENYVYTIQGNNITLIGPKGDKTSAVYYPEDHPISYTLLTYDDFGNLITSNIFFKK